MQTSFEMQKYQFKVHVIFYPVAGETKTLSSPNWYCQRVEILFIHRTKLTQEHFNIFYDF